LGAINIRRDKGWLLTLPKMSCMLLIFPPSRRELINSVACALGVREKRELNRRLNNYKHEGSRGLREEEEEAN
jgi:hypothetical protein